MAKTPRSPGRIRPSTIDSLTTNDLTGGDVTTFSLDADFDVLTRSWLATQPLMEVAPPPAVRFLTTTGRRRHMIKVHDGWNVESASLVTQLKPHALLRVLETRELSDGSKQALVVLHRSLRPLGWLTMTTADGEAILHIYARPVYEVASNPAKVRKQFDQASRCLGTLPVGTLLHVVETRRAPHGGQRVAARVLGDLAITGWITSTKSDGTRMLREVEKEAVAVERHEEQIRPLSARRRSSPSGASRTPRSPSPQSSARSVIGQTTLSHSAPPARRKRSGSQSARGTRPSSARGRNAETASTPFGMPSRSAVTHGAMVHAHSSGCVGFGGGGSSVEQVAAQTRADEEMALSVAARKNWRLGFTLINNSVSSFKSLQHIDKKLNILLEQVIAIDCHWLPLIAPHYQPHRTVDWHEDRHVVVTDT